MNTKRKAIIWAGAAVLAASLLASSGPQAETANCIVAVVNDQIITLIDVKLVEAFGFFETGPAASAPERRRFILDKLIDQKVIIELARIKTKIDRAKVDEELNGLLARIGGEEVKRRLEQFGLEAADLKPYLSEKILAEAIIADRFGRSVIVSLREIEAYYAQTYVPEQKKLGREPKPFIDVVDILEAEIKKIKAENQVALWIKNLREQAEIERRLDCLKN